MDKFNLIKKNNYSIFAYYILFIVPLFLYPLPRGESKGEHTRTNIPNE